MPTIPCDYCGDEHYRRPANLTENNFCSMGCYGEWQSENRAGENHHQYNSIDVECQNCGNEKKVNPSHNEKVDNHFCDIDCQIEYEDRSKENNSQWDGGKTTTSCDYCEDKVSIYPYRLKETNHQFCNQDCKDRWTTKNFAGKNHPLWDGGDFYYGDTWPIMRKKVQSRDENICRLCGIGESEIGRKPDVHHIEPVRSFDDCENAHTMDNMIQVCRGCHRTLETNTPDEQMEIIEQEVDSGAPK